MVPVIKSLIIQFYGHDCVPMGSRVPNTQNCIAHVSQGLVIRNKKQNQTKSNQTKKIPWQHLKIIENDRRA